MKIIFLDIDGVINPWRAEKDSSGRFGQEALENFKLILDAVPDALIVITSTWRFHFTFPEIKEFFDQAGINSGRILDIVPDLRRDSGSTRYYPGRDEEIKAWLEQHPEVEKFAILDDVDLEQMEGLEEHFFQTEFEEGLTHEQSLKIIKHLSNN
ncbi:MAG: HAD domain-containing protein [Acidobacteria bacterium]|jgi:hypothetical protein|nr:HAD domain-containing protein [Acidobacteriota bacterium]